MEDLRMYLRIKYLLAHVQVEAIAMAPGGLMDVMAVRHSTIESPRRPK